MGSERAGIGRRATDAVAPSARRVPPPGRTAPAGLDLQHHVGNRVATQLLAAGQAKLEVGPAGDRHEQEADAVARQVVAALRTPAATPAPGPSPDEEPVARRSVLRRRAIGAEGGTLDAGTEDAIRSARRGGSALEGGTRSRLEGAFGGADFSRVRLHAGPAAADLNQRVQAKAFTVGNDIFFRDRLPDTGSAGGQELLAHELTHTLQQGG